ncbi:MAG: hypothetical protein ABIF82_13780 [Planctomycetota bacterium]
MSEAKEKDLVEAVLNAARERDGRLELLCADAFEVAARLDVEPLEIGRICNQKKIKIGKCQLGCFK